MSGYDRAEAMALCNKVREQSQAFVSTPNRMQCWHCQQQAGGDFDRMYMARKPGYLGCDLMNTSRARSARARDV